MPWSEPIPILPTPELDHPWLRSEAYPKRFGPQGIVQALCAAQGVARAVDRKIWSRINFETIAAYAYGPTVAGEAFAPNFNLYVHIPGLPNEDPTRPRTGMFPSPGGTVKPTVVVMGDFATLATSQRRKIQLDIATCGLHVAGPAYEWPEELPVEPLGVASWSVPEFVVALSAGIPQAQSLFSPEWVAAHPARAIEYLAVRLIVEHKVYSNLPARQADMLAEQYPELAPLYLTLLKYLQEPPDAKSIQKWAQLSEYLLAHLIATYSWVIDPPTKSE